MVLSCEQLYMRYVDAEMDQSVSSLFADLDREMQAATTVRLTDASWLARGDLKRRLDAVLDAFRARGGRLEVGR
jgi:hypothetical protein